MPTYIFRIWTFYIFHLQPPARQIVRNLSVDLMLERDCTSGRLPMKYKYTNNLANNCKHIELFYEGKILTHSSVDKNILPRKSIFRKSYASTNQISLDYA